MTRTVHGCFVAPNHQFQCIYFDCELVGGVGGTASMNSILELPVITVIEYVIEGKEMQKWHSSEIRLSPVLIVAQLLYTPILFS
uniref:Uncharacterized protein n=1 Tax=Lactuca sativa TaxID=4236 RepID=A0A9R1XMP6_LACSA|nr:hypothetical protein LSAT_V11C300109700 [Lactuca sativa]